MKFPVGIIKGEQLNTIFEEFIKYHIENFHKIVSEYEPKQLYSNWRSLVRSIDEIINIPMELSDENEINCFLELSFNFLDTRNQFKLKKVLVF
jgi:hypothetical protein